MDSARYAMLMLGARNERWLGMNIKRRLCAASRDRAATPAIICRRREGAQSHLPLASPAERKRTSELVALAIGVHLSAEPNGNERVDGAERVVRDDEAEILEGVAIRVVAPANRAPKFGVLELRIAPRPAIRGTNCPLSIKLLSELVLVRLSRRWDRRVGPEGLSCEKPGGSVGGRRVGLRVELTAGNRVKGTTLREMLHPLVVVEIADRARCAERSARNLAREVPVRHTSLTTLARIGGVPRPGVRFHREIRHKPILPEPRLPGTRDDRRRENRPWRRTRSVLLFPEVRPRVPDNSRRRLVCARRGKRAREALTSGASERYGDGRDGGHRRRAWCQNKYLSERYVGALPASAERPVRM